MVQLGPPPQEVRSKFDLSFLTFNGATKRKSPTLQSTKTTAACSKIQYKCQLESVLSILITDIWNGGRQIIKEKDERMVGEKSDWNIQRLVNLVLHSLTHPSKNQLFDF